MFKLPHLLITSLAVLTAWTCLAEPAPENPIVLGNTRITVLTPTLFRVEYAREAKFVDAPTMFAYDRSCRFNDFKFRQIGPIRYEIETDAYRMWFDNDGFPPSAGQFNMKLYLKRDGKEIELKGSNSRNNLGGAISTLDQVRGRVLTSPGLLSRDGWYMIDDSAKDLVIDGGLQQRDRSHVSDRYYFVYGDDYQAALASLGAVSGNVPMARKTMFGFWYCRWWDYTADEYLKIIDGYDENDFPIDNIVFDMGWHLQKEATTGTGASVSRGWTGYSWNPKYMPDPADLIRKVHDRGLTVSLNDHPHDGYRPHETYYADFLDEIRREKPELICNDSMVLFDLGDSTYMKTFFKYSHEPIEKIGLDFWWLDWQQNYLYPRVQGTTTPSLSWINKLYYDRSVRNGLRGASYSRWAGWGDQRYPIQFSGDAVANWDVLAFSVELTGMSSNAGCYYWAHDIGGFYGGKDPELYVRWSQFGALSASLKIHSTRDPKLDRRPWLHGDTATIALRDAYHLRARLMPYIYTSVYKAHKTMLPLIRQMYVDYPKADAAYKNPQQYLFGDHLIVAPITTQGKGDNLMATQTVWLPEDDTWYDWFSGQAYQGGQTRGIAKDIYEFPLFVRGGWIIPMQPYSSRPATELLTQLVLRCYPGEEHASNTYTLYEDDGISDGCDKGVYAQTPLTYKRNGATVTIKIAPTEGNYKNQPQMRSYRVELAAVNSCGKVKAGNTTLKAVRDDKINGYVVDVPACTIRKATVITFENVK